MLHVCCTYVARVLHVCCTCVARVLQMWCEDASNTHGLEADNQNNHNNLHPGWRRWGRQVCNQCGAVITVKSWSRRASMRTWSNKAIMFFPWNPCIQCCLAFGCPTGCGHAENSSVHFNFECGGKGGEEGTQTEFKLMLMQKAHTSWSTRDNIFCFEAIRNWTCE
jgi:hypothetical protein